jgi:hypothetical protein
MSNNITLWRLCWLKNRCFNNNGGSPSYFVEAMYEMRRFDIIVEFEPVAQPR